VRVGLCAERRGCATPNRVSVHGAGGVSLSDVLACLSVRVSANSLEPVLALPSQCCVQRSVARVRVPSVTAIERWHHTHIRGRVARDVL
jgi:hypothetical protein